MVSSGAVHVFFSKEDFILFHQSSRTECVELCFHVSVLFLGCGRGCANCSAPGLCTECNEGLKLLTPPNSNITKCVRKCPPFYKLDKDSSLPRCELRAKPNNSK